MKDIQSKMVFMKAGDGEGFDADALKKLLDGYTTKDDFSDLKSRVEKLEIQEKELQELTEKHSHKLKDHSEKLKDHSEDIEKLKKKKVDSDHFESEITFIKNLLNKHSGDKIDLSSMGG
jgi:predicted  nucleic acid-binding Zn-ribbon protein